MRYLLQMVTTTLRCRGPVARHPGAADRQQARALRSQSDTLHRTEPKAAEPAEDEDLREKLFAAGTSIELDDKNHAAIGGARRSHAAFCETPDVVLRSTAAGTVLVSCSACWGQASCRSATVGGFGPDWWFLTPPDGSQSALRS
jgi:hypothetical protein